VTEIQVRQDGVWPPYLAWCPESNCLVVTDSLGEGKPAALFLVSLESGEKRQLTNPQPLTPGDTNPAISPDGRWLVFRRNASGPFTGELYRLALAKSFIAMGEPQRLTAALDANHPTWLPDSKEILFSAPSVRGNLWRLNVVDEKPGDAQPTRLPFVGEDGIMPVVSRAPVSSGLRSQLRRREYLAPRFVCSWGAGVLAATHRHLLHGRGLPSPVFSRRPPGGVWIVALGRTGNMDGRS